MTTIRRITVSQINGNDANTNDVNEIRPFGETAFYIDESNNPNILVLSMHDGLRTHLKSKVLSPGVMFGSNADSGDGAGYDTIKLIPDALLYNQGSQQYFIIDPTVPDHIHLRAGGTIDNSNASLYIGGENSHLNIPSGSNPPVIITANNNAWIFGTNGGLSFPGIEDDSTPVIDFFYSGGNNHKVTLASDWTLKLKARADGSNEGHLWLEAGQNTKIKIHGNGSNIEIIASTGTNAQIWNFDSQGVLTVPSGGSILFDNSATSIITGPTSIEFADNTVQTTAYRFVTPPVSSTSTGVVGSLAQDATYFYVCTATNSWQRIAWDITPW